MAARGRKRNVDTKTPPGPKPDPPAWLDDAARTLWDKYSDTINRLGLLESLDDLSFALLCGSISTLFDMQEQFTRNPDYTNLVGKNGALQVNPLCQLIAQQTKAVLTLAAEFGMTPRGRINLTGSLSCSPETIVDPMEELLKELANTSATITKPLKEVPKKGTKAAKKVPKKGTKKRAAK
jgi:P27 family predicted phage terminase small subunit